MNGMIKICGLRRAGGFNPAMVSPVYWIIGDDAATGVVNTWPPVPTYGPTVNAGVNALGVDGVYNGHRAVEFNAAAFLDNASTPLPTGLSKASFAFVHTTDPASNSVWLTLSGTGPRCQVFATSQYFVFQTGAFGHTGAIATPAIQTIWVFDGTQVGDAARLTCWVNGVQEALVFSGVGVVPPTLDIPAATITVGKSPSVGTPAKGRLGEFVISNIAYTTTQIAKMYAYAHATYGV